MIIQKLKLSEPYDVFMNFVILENAEGSLKTESFPVPFLNAIHILKISQIIIESYSC